MANPNVIKMKKIVFLLVSIVFISCSDTKTTEKKSNSSTSSTDETKKKLIIENEKDTTISHSTVEESREDSTTSSVQETEKEEDLEKQTEQEKQKSTEEKEEEGIVSEDKTVEDIVDEKPIEKKEPENVVKEVVTNDVLFVEWTSMLQKYVSYNGNVNYKAWKTNHATLKKYLKTISGDGIQQDWSRKEKLAYWINIYNAYTVDLVLDYYPTKKGLANVDKAWHKKFINIAGRTYSLNEIENDIIRPRFNEPRIHFAVNCAAKSCPKLYNKAFNSKELYSQLERLTRQYIQNTIHNKMGKDHVQLSKIFEWYRVDFDNNGGLLNFIKKYSKTTIEDNAKITFLEYNWTLNE